MKLFSYLFTQRINMHVFEGCKYDVKMSLNTCCSHLLIVTILGFFYQVHILLMSVCILAVVTVHDTCIDSHV